jgi:hypothetical protein
VVAALVVPVRHLAAAVSGQDLAASRVVEAAWFLCARQ